MNRHLATLCPRTVDPITNRFGLGFKSVDTVIADTFDVKDVDTTLTFFNPKRAVISRSFTGDELTRRRHVVDVGVLSRGGGMKQSQLVLELLRQVYYRESQPPVSINTTSSARGG